MAAGALTPRLVRGVSGLYIVTVEVANADADLPRLASCTQAENDVIGVCAADS